MTDDLEALRHILENLRDIFSKLARRATTTRAAACLGTMGLDFTRQMVWQRTPGRLPRFLLHLYRER
jgi:hypothetical protein